MRFSRDQAFGHGTYKNVTIKELVQTTVSKEDMAALRRQAEVEGTTIAAVLRRLVRQWADTPAARALMNDHKP
jgi:hypothetical protein